MASMTMDMTMNSDMMTTDIGSSNIQDVVVSHMEGASEIDAGNLNIADNNLNIGENSVDMGSMGYQYQN